MALTPEQQARLAELESRMVPPDPVSTGLSEQERVRLSQLESKMGASPQEPSRSGSIVPKLIEGLQRSVSPIASIAGAVGDYQQGASPLATNAGSQSLLAQTSGLGQGLMGPLYQYGVGGIQQALGQGAPGGYQDTVSSVVNQQNQLQADNPISYGFGMGLGAVAPGGIAGRTTKAVSAAIPGSGPLSTLGRAVAGNVATGQVLADVGTSIEDRGQQAGLDALTGSVTGTLQSGKQMLAERADKGANRTINWLLKSKDRTLADEVRREGWTKAKNLDDLANLATNDSRAATQKLNSILSVQPGSINIKELTKTPAVEKLVDQLKISGEAAKADGLLNVISEIEGNGAVSLKRANEIKQALWSQGYTNLGNEKNSPVGTAQRIIGNRIKEAIEERVGGETVKKLNQTIGSAFRVTERSGYIENMLAKQDPLNRFDVGAVFFGGPSAAAMVAARDLAASQRAKFGLARMFEDLSNQVPQEARQKLVQTLSNLAGPGQRE